MEPLTQRRSGQPRLKASAVGLGSAEEVQDYAETDRLKFKTSSLAKKRLSPDRLKIMYGKGDSMLTRIRSGDAIMYDTSDTREVDGKLDADEQRELLAVLCEFIQCHESGMESPNVQQMVERQLQSLHRSIANPA